MPNIIYNPNEIDVNTTENIIEVNTTVNEIAVHTEPIIIDTGGGGTLPDDAYNKMYVTNSVPGTNKEGDEWYSPLTGRVETRAEGEWKSTTLDGQSF